LIIGEGVKMFGNSKKKIILSLISNEGYDNGLMINTYNISYL